MRPNGSCPDCVYSVPTNAPDGTPILQCRAMPPEASVIVIPVQQGPTIANPLAGVQRKLLTQVVSVWPTVSASDVCWQFNGGEPSQ